MRADRFTALIDASVLVGALNRNIILSLAEAGFFRPRWSKLILDETERGIVKAIKKADAEERAARARNAIDRAFPEAIVTSYETLIDGLTLPDSDDRHVLAAAIHSKSAIIVTENLKDFPEEELAKFEISPQNPDDFIADAMDLNRVDAMATLERMRLRLKNPAFTTEELIRRMEQCGLVNSASIWISGCA